jgi:serine/threonine protein kinase
MTTPPAGHDNIVGQTLGHYRIVERIGAGGIGEVYRAHDEHLDRDVAIKVLPSDALSDKSSRRGFRKEALALSKLNHPNIATIYDFDTQQGVDFLVMEYISGATLSEKLAGRPLPEKEIIALGTQLAEGLSAAHERGVVHRDLKPGNLRLTTDGRLKVLDFGLARLLAPTTTEAETESMTQDVMGTLPYMAPEQLLGKEIDARTDIHAAGSVLYEMAAGQRPFAELGQAQLIAGILHRPPVPPSTVNRGVSLELERIIEKCLEKELENRYQSAKELAVDLRRIAMAGLTTQVLLPARSHRGSAIRTGALTVVLVVLLIVGGLIFRSGRANALNPSDTIVLADFVNYTPDAVFDDALNQALTVELEQSPFLKILPQAKIRDTLGLMGRSPDASLTPEVGREVCQRAGGKALLWGTIAPLGTQYVIGLTAAECSTGNHLASEQTQSANKEDVLKALGKAASHLRSKLGESLSSVQKFDTPLEQATTPSLEALKAYSLGRISTRKLPSYSSV